MRKILLMVGIFLNSFAFSQVAEDFNDGEVLHHPQWVGDTGRFVVNNTKQLQSKLHNKSDTSFLATNNQHLLNTSWEFYVQINVDPSTSNQMRIYLAHDKANLDSPGNGYFIQIGETGTQDSYDLYRKSGKNIIKIIDGPAKPRARTDTIKTWFYVIHRTDGYWELYSRSSPEDAWQAEGNCFDRVFRQSTYSGLSIKHTSTRSDKFILDDLWIYPYDVDTAAPEYVDIEIRDSIISVLFSEEIDTIGLYQTANYKLNGSISARKVYKDALNTSLIHLAFPQMIQGGKINLEIPALSDFLGNKNTSPYYIQYTYIAPISYQKNDVFISEIMADPSPSIDLPEAEYIEWYNSTDKDIHLKDWIFGNGNSNLKLKEQVLKAKSFIVFCKASDTNLFKPYGDVIGLSTWPSVGNGSGILRIRDHQGNLIDEVNYNTTWYKNKSKSNGGYSLECTQSQKSCEGIYVWEASNHVKGGSPGTLNSFWNKPTETFFVYQFDFLNDSSIYIRFNKAADSSLALSKKSYQLNNPDRFPQKVKCLNDYYTEYILLFNEKFKNNKPYEFKFNNIKTCDGIGLDDQLFSFIYRNDDDTSLIRINELMIDPNPVVALADAEYIELFNTTKNYVNLSSYTLTIGSTKLIFPTYLLRPNEYLLLCASGDTLELKKYGNVISFNNFPSLSNTVGTIQLNNKAGRLIDKISYKSSWYRDVTKSDGGWSIELIDPYSKCKEINRWNASNHKKGGTPCKINSVADFYADQRKLSLKSVKNYNNYQFVVNFNKPVLGHLINPAQLYFVGPRLKLYFPDVVALDSPYYERATLTFKSPLPPGKYNLVCQYIPSCSSNDTNIIYPMNLHVTEEMEDEIALSEIMADPNPSNGLPECEYIELYNKGTKDLVEISFYLADTKDTIPLHVENWKAGEYIVVCHKNYRNAWPETIRMIPVNKMLSLGNEGDTLSVLSFLKSPLDKIDYSLKMLPKEKVEGGYAYTKIKDTWYCNSKYSWQASNQAMGGSPGIQNESMEEYPLPKLQVTNYSLKENIITLTLNENIKPSEEFIIENSLGELLNYTLNEIGDLLISLNKSLDEGALDFIKLHYTNCMGMSLDTILQIHQKYAPKQGDILISELLFNPEPNGYDFIEVYNASDKTINIHDLTLFNGKEKIAIREVVPLKSNNQYIQPKSYRVFSLNTEDISNRYSVPYKEHLIQVNKIPSLPDEEGIISILDTNELLIDQFVYHKNMHYTWLDNTEGRSLERKVLEYEYRDRSNWASASDNIGKASPTGINSQYKEKEEESTGSFWLSKKLIKPYSGKEGSELELHYNIEGETVFMNVKLFSVSGSFISEVMHGLSIRNSGMVKWDLANNGKLVPAGTYILSIECYTEKGKNQQYKLPFAVHY